MPEWERTVIWILVLMHSFFWYQTIGQKEPHPELPECGQVEEASKLLDWVHHRGGQLGTQSNTHTNRRGLV